MTTYEYIIQGRQRQSVQDMNSDLESACEASPPPPKTLDRLSVSHLYQLFHLYLFLSVLFTIK